MAAKQRDQHYARVMWQQNTLLTVAAMVIHALTALSVRSNPTSLAWVGGTVLVLMPFNAWVTLVLLKRRSALFAETLRTAVNVAVALIAAQQIGWPLPVWLWMPYIGVSYDGFSRRVTWSVLAVTCAANGAFAIREGVSWIIPLAFAMLAFFLRISVETRIGILRKMFDQSELDRVELDRAHDSLRAAHEELQRAAEARDRAEGELRQAQKLEAVGRLASGVAHEINTPLQYVMNSADLLGQGIDDLIRGFDRLRAPCLDESDMRARLAAVESEMDFEFLRSNLPDASKMSLEGLEQIADIVRSMRSFVASDPQLVQTDINRAVRMALDVARHEYCEVAEVALELGELPHIFCFPGPMHQVLLNLLVNASHAVAEKPRPRGAKGRITVRTRVEGDSVIVDVGDDGAGIPDAVRDRIFEPFFTTKPIGRGTGQGLSISRGIVDQHEGQLDFDTAAGRGTTFHVRLPIIRRLSRQGAA